MKPKSLSVIILGVLFMLAGGIILDSYHVCATSSILLILGILGLIIGLVSLSY